MKKISAIMFFFLAFFGSCRKEEKNISLPAPKDKISAGSLTVTEVRSWLAGRGSSKLRTSATTNSFDLQQLQLPWENIKSGRNNTGGDYLFLKLNGEPTFQHVKQGSRSVLFSKDAGSLKAYVVEVVPDALAYQRSGIVNAATFTGRVFIYTDTYQFVGGYIYINGKLSGGIKPKNSAANLKTASVDAGNVSSTCEWVDADYINSQGEAVIYSEKVCTYDLTDISQDMPSDLPPIGQSPPDYTEGGGSSGGAPAVSNLPGEQKTKINPREYMQCFSNLPDIGSKMTVTVYVQEPAAGLPFNYGPNSVGHTAIGLTKTYNGQSITQVVGFYPDATGKSKMHAPSKVLDNSDLEYNVSISYSIIASEFNKIVNFISNPPGTYDLLNYNCTNFAFNACMAGGIKLPDPVGNMGLGQTGMTPGALGNTIRDAGNVANSNLKGGTIAETHGPCNK